MSEHYVDLSPYWPELQELARQRYDQKDGWASARYWNIDSHFLGLCGELLYGMATNQPINTDLLAHGDGGTDFPGGVDVKTTRFEFDAYLKHPVGAKHWPDVFVLCYVNKEQKRGRILGWTYSDVVWVSGEVQDFGHGPQYTLHQQHLMPIEGLPLAIKEATRE